MAARITMLRFLFSAVWVLSCLTWFLPHVNGQKVVQMSMRKRNTTLSLGKRDPFAISLQNYIPGAEYYVTALIGNPPQDIEFVLDTGSSDVWMFGPGSCNHRTSSCDGGEFDISRSHTAKYVPGGRGLFQIQYVSQGSYVMGDYFTDNLSVGGVEVRDMVMGVARSAAYVPSGIMGIGLSRNEASIDQGLGRYLNFPDLLVKQGKIKSKSYSLYLDDIGSSTGMMIFGGYDKEKFVGELIMLPVQVDTSSGRRSSFIVSWSSMGVADASGEYTILHNGDLLYPAVLDTGTTLTYVPSAIYAGLASYFRVIPRGRGQPGRIDCNFGQENPGQVIYGFGGQAGTQISVEFDELVIPLYSGGQRAFANDGQPLCVFGIVDTGSNPILLGQTFLRSAYVLYDLDNLQVGLAQTVFDSVESKVVEYNGLPAPRVDKVQGPSVTESGTVVIPSIIGTPVPTGLNGASGRVSAVATDYTIATVSYPSQTPPSSFPTTIPIGPTGRIPFSSGNGDSGGSGSNGLGNTGNHQTQGNGNVGSHGAGTGDNSKSGTENGNGSGESQAIAGLPSPKLALSGACFVMLLSSLLWL